MSVTVSAVPPSWIAEKLQVFANPLFSFEPVAHKYLWDTAELMSITTWSKHYKGPFVSYARAQATAQFTGQSVEEVLAEWDGNRNLGTDVHTFIELHEKRENGPIPIMASNPDTQLRCRKFLDIRTTQFKDFVSISAELRLYLLSRGLAGTLDWLAWHVPTQTLWVFDWKTCKKIVTDKVGRSYGFLFGPFSDLADNEHNFYSIQLSWYRVMLAEAGIPTAGGIIVHLPGGQQEAKAYKARDFTQRLLALAA